MAALSWTSRLIFVVSSVILIAGVVLMAAPGPVNADDDTALGACPDSTPPNCKGTCSGSNDCGENSTTGKCRCYPVS